NEKYLAKNSTMWFNKVAFFIKSWVRELARYTPRQPVEQNFYKVVMLTTIRETNSKHCAFSIYT
ncbi:MAG: hypothetical protein RR624_06185, partial [Longicatena sp.]